MGKHYGDGFLRAADEEDVLEYGNLAMLRPGMRLRLLHNIL